MQCNASVKNVACNTVQKSSTERITKVSTVAKLKTYLCIYVHVKIQGEKIPQLTICSGTMIFIVTWFWDVHDVATWSSMFAVKCIFYSKWRGCCFKQKDKKR